MKDYYQILGLNTEATEAAIKLAYRKLALEFHPDRVKAGAEEEETSARMAEINEAYNVLSDADRRREYNRQMMLERAGEPARAAAAAAGPVAAPPTEVPARQEVRSKVRPDAGTAATTLEQFSYGLRQRLLGNRSKFGWDQQQLEGFDWAVLATFWNAQYWVASRAFAALDPAGASRFTQYATKAISEKSGLRPCYFLLLAPFQRAVEAERVTKALRQSNTGWGPRVLLVMMDATHQRMLPLSAVNDARFQEVLKTLGIKSGRN